jgi:hypothetical protein
LRLQVSTHTHCRGSQTIQPEKAERPIGRTNAVVMTRRELIPWIWQGVVAERAVTLLSAPENVGNAG